MPPARPRSFTATAFGRAGCIIRTGEEQERNMRVAGGPTFPAMAERRCALEATSCSSTYRTVYSLLPTAVQQGSRAAVQQNSNAVAHMSTVCLLILQEQYITWTLHLLHCHRGPPPSPSSWNIGFGTLVSCFQYRGR